MFVELVDASYKNTEATVTSYVLLCGDYVPTSAMANSCHNKPRSLEREVKSSEDGERLPIHGGVIENGHTRNPPTLWTVPVLVHVGYGCGCIRDGFFLD